MQGLNSSSFGESKLEYSFPLLLLVVDSHGVSLKDVKAISPEPVFISTTIR